jgi:hypothetical protein
MDERNDSRLDPILKDIEFPGEKEVHFSGYLSNTGFTDAVMKKVFRHRRMANRALAWGLIALFNFTAILFMGTGNSFVREYLSFHTTLNYLFFMFLGLGFVGSLCGLILNIDTSWMKMFEFRDIDGYVRNLQKRIT